MPWPAIKGFHEWTAKRKGLLQGLLKLAVEGIAVTVPGGVPVVWATRILGEFAQHGIERLADTSASVPEMIGSIKIAITSGSQLPVWRSLPRGFVIEGRWRIDSEAGRGGMASVYRAEGIDDINKGQIAAIKIPAPGLLDDAASHQRFVQEIKVTQKMSSGSNRFVVQTLGYVHLTDPHTSRPLYGLVLEYIDGQTLAPWLAQRQEIGKPLTLKEIQDILEPVCDALEYAHSQTPPILHCDLKPHNVMRTSKGQIKLLDFGIARILEDRRQTVTGVMGTRDYLPPEFLDPDYQPDVRSDVYLAATLLVELLRFHRHGNPEKRTDCPKTWLKLIGDARNPLLSLRPPSIHSFWEVIDWPRDPIINSIGMKLTQLPSGTFLMGSPDSESGRHRVEGPQHEVRMSHSFHMGVCPVTQEQFERLMGQNPAHFNAGNGGGSNHPVENASWQDAIEFCRRLSHLPTEREASRVYRLPTEAEWEYACRAGTTSVFHFGNAMSSNDANFDAAHPYGSAAEGTNLGRTSPVGSYPSNAFGLFDMHGNIWEWCADWAVEFREDNYYSNSPNNDPQGLTHGKYRIIRGGSWCDPAKNCRSATRGASSPGRRQNWLGFRVVLVSGART